MWQNWPNQTALIRKWIWQGCLSLGVPGGERQTNKTERRRNRLREREWLFNKWPQGGGGKREKDRFTLQLKLRSNPQNATSNTYNGGYRWINNDSSRTSEQFIEFTVSRHQVWGDRNCSAFRYYSSRMLNSLCQLQSWRKRGKKEIGICIKEWLKVWTARVASTTPAAGLVYVFMPVCHDIEPQIWNRNLQHAELSKDASLLCQSKKPPAVL